MDSLQNPVNTIINGVNMRDGNIRDYPFVTGYTLRANWASLEPQQGVYDFSIIDYNIGRLEAIGKKLTLLLDGSASMEPAYVVEGALSEVFSFTDTGPDHQAGTADDFVSTRPVPWNSYAQARLSALAQALASHTIGGVALRDHPVLMNIDMGIPGLSHIRDKEVSIVDIPGYNRDSFKQTVIQSLHAATDHFPNQYVYIGLWKLKNDGISPELAEDLRTTILAEFDGVKNPLVGFFHEDLEAHKDLITGATSYVPNPTGNAFPLFLSKDVTYTMFQAGQVWTPPSDAATPGDAMQYAYDTFGTIYFELYAIDIDNQVYGSLLQQWHDLLQK